MSDGKTGWTTLSSEEIHKTPFVRIISDRAQLPDGRVCPRYYTLEFGDWVNIVPVTEDGRILLIRQYRYPVRKECLEIPGGAIDPRLHETPEQGANRELEEETGYVSQSMRLLGRLDPNPALQNNTLWVFLAEGCKKSKNQKLDEFEEIETFTASLQEVQGYVREGRLSHSLCVAALALAMPLLMSNRPSPP